MKISVVITTSPGRESNLACCLTCIEKQTYLPTDVVIVDDGSISGHQIVQIYKGQLNTTYYWKPNTCCVSHSRNKGAQLAQGELIVFIDSDILLNPLALEHYLDYFQHRPFHILYGYYGTYRYFEAPSLWFPDRTINWLDGRFVFHQRDFIKSPPDIFKHPQRYGWSGNFAILKSSYEVIGGFNERIMAWGFEDVEFANIAMNKGCELHFSLDVWAEHLFHDVKGRFHRISHQAEIKQYKARLYDKFEQREAIHYPLHLRDKKVKDLAAYIFDYYRVNTTRNESFRQ